MHVFWARLASYGHLDLISDLLIISKFPNETHDPKGQETKIYTIVKGRETFYRRHKVPINSCSEVKYVFKKVILCTKELKLECASFLDQNKQSRPCLPCCCIRDSLKFDMRHDHILTKLNFDLLIPPPSRRALGSSLTGITALCP